MCLHNKVWSRLTEFVTRQVTGQLIFHFHKGVLTRCEMVQVETVSKWGAYAPDHGALITEQEKQHDYHR